MGARVVHISAVIEGGASRTFRWRPRNVPVPVFVAGRANRCPDCHGEAFTVGRITAECAGCGLPLAIVHSRRIM
jgi:hypothetical protein